MLKYSWQNIQHFAFAQIVWACLVPGQHSPHHCSMAGVLERIGATATVMAVTISGSDVTLGLD